MLYKYRRDSFKNSLGPERNKNETYLNNVHACVTKSMSCECQGTGEGEGTCEVEGKSKGEGDG